MIEFAWAVLSAWIDVTVYKGLGPTCTSGRAVGLCSSQVHQTRHHSSLLTTICLICFLGRSSLCSDWLPARRIKPIGTLVGVRPFPNGMFDAFSTYNLYSVVLLWNSTKHHLMYAHISLSFFGDSGSPMCRVFDYYLDVE